MSKTLRIKKNILEKEGEINEFSLTRLCNLFAKWSACKNNQEIFCSSHQEWIHNGVLAFELTVLGHFLFTRDVEGVDTRLLVFREQIEKGHTFVPTLLALSEPLLLHGPPDHRT